MPAQLLQLLHRIDDKVKELRADEQCEWVRSKLGVIGFIRVAEPVNDDALDALLGERIAHAHALLDELSDDDLQLEDLWNIVLLIAVPWTRDAMATLPETARVLLSWVRDTSGSRKIIVWSGTTVEDYLGPLGGGLTGWMPPTGDPLRAAVGAAARDAEEARALEVLFKRRIDESDFELLIKVLGRKSTS